MRFSDNDAAKVEKSFFSRNHYTVTEEQLIRETRELLIRTFQPEALFMAVPLSSPAASFQVHTYFQETSKELESFADQLAILLESDFESFSEETIDGFQSISTKPRALVKSDPTAPSRILLLLFGVDCSTAQSLSTLRMIQENLRLGIENLRLNSKLARLACSSDEWEDIFQSIADPIYIIDTEYRFKKMNRALLSFSMKQEEELEGRNCYRYLFQRNTVCPWCPVPEGVKTGEPVTIEAPLFAERMWQIQSFPYMDGGKNRAGSINVLRDMTILKRMQEQLIESEKLASTGKLISGVAHEVRNPLFGISTTVRALANELKGIHAIAPYIDIITSETTRLNRLMEDLLNYSRPLQIDKDPSDLSEIVKEVIERVTYLPSAQNVLITFYNSDYVPAINLDRDKIKQVLFNLLENAVQHSRGEMKIEVFLQYLSLAVPAEIHLVVKDNGTGILPEHLPKIFDPFFTTRKRGTGLGLSIVRKVIHDHGGRITVESHPGFGTTFRISLPVTEKE